MSRQVAVTATAPVSAWDNDEGRVRLFEDMLIQAGQEAARQGCRLGPEASRVVDFGQMIESPGGVLFVACPKEQAMLVAIRMAWVVTGR